MREVEAALGMIETWGVPALIAAADAAAKTADVRITTYEKADAGLVTVYIRGDVSAVKSAVDAGAAAASKVGTLVSAHVIARPDAELTRMLQPKDEAAGQPAGGKRRPTKSSTAKEVNKPDETGR